MESQSLTHGVPRFTTAAILLMSLVITATTATFLGFPALRSLW